MRKIAVVLAIILSLITMTSCAGSNKKIEDTFSTVCSADEALALAKSSGAVVFEFQGCTSGQDTWDAFYKDVSAGKAASVLCARYYTLDKEGVSEELYEQEKDQYPQLYFNLLKFDGKTYSVETRLSTEQKAESEETYAYLQHYTGDAPTKGALYEKYEYYVLTDDKDVTWDEISRSMFSSSSPDFIRHCMVYDNYTGWRGI